MNFSLYAKALAALVVSMLTAFAQFTPLVSGGAGGIVAVVGAFLTALAVYFISNRHEGANVSEVAQQVIAAGFEIVEQEAAR
ncbi:hypothetical protein [Falsiruegeria litorea]|uniref:hypothetical protein n=1 Tax=Falsiruegeria litorea TaxID=1280831 RepID=UPI001BFD4443|nr:hypothetical protein [Falsiruegeria litorea]MBT8169878.1 hypothetical protein [Falsiruegeria litorea]